jgi:hypothetical protein
MLSVTNIDLYSYKCLAVDKICGKNLARGATGDVAPYLNDSATASGDYRLNFRPKLAVAPAAGKPTYS